MGTPAVARAAGAIVDRRSGVRLVFTGIERDQIGASREIRGSRHQPTADQSANQSSLHTCGRTHSETG